MTAGTEEKGNSADAPVTIMGTAAQKLLFLRGSVRYADTKLY